MNPFESIWEKSDSHIIPHKPKPLCSCFIGDKMVDMYVRFNFDKKCVGWSKVYKGYAHEESCFDDMSVYDGTNGNVNDTIKVIDEYFYYHQLYLH